MFVSLLQVRDTDRQTDRQTYRQTQTDTDTQTDIQTDTDRQQGFVSSLTDFLRQETDVVFTNTEVRQV